MPLPVLQHRPSPTENDLLRLFLQTENRWSQHIAEEQVLDVGTVYANPALAPVYQANHICDAALPDGMPADDAIALVDAHFSERGVRCAYWVFNCSAPAERAAPIIERLLAQGFRKHVLDLLILDRAPAPMLTPPPGIRIIPARAAFGHTRRLFDEIIAERSAPPEVAESWMLHLDDPHWDALLALRDGDPVAYLGVYSAGEVGRIEDVMVSPRHRRQGIGRTMMHRALEICARALFKHVMLCVLPNNAPAQALYAGLGFRRLTEFVGYCAPWTKP